MRPRSVPQRSNGLVAIILITRPRSGPKLTFHYPPAPTVGTHSCDSDVADYDDRVEDSETEEVDFKERSSEEVARSGRTSSDTNHVLGYSVDSLERLLSPGRWSNGHKFEICLDGLTFLSHPIYADEDGSWLPRDGSTAKDTRPPQTETDNTPTEARKTSLTGDEPEPTTSATSITITAPETLAGPAIHDFTHLPESLDSQGGSSLGTSMNSTSTTSNVMLGEQMAMFNVVFVLSTTSQDEIKAMYQHVVKKLSKALQYCQKQSGYVAVQSRRLLALKAKAKQDRTDSDTGFSSMYESSELAWALKELYEKLSAGDVAGFRLNGMETSLQIPLPGMSNDREEELNPHSGLLLLDEKDILLYELSHPDASPLAYFIREHLPTKSFQKSAARLNIPVHDAIYLARHLIKWRKARVIAPLHARNIYVVSPDAPMDKLADLIPEYARQFAALPSLPQMLKMLGGKPLKYGLLIPSRDHRMPYMDILAYLLRHGFVRQLKTYGWLQSSGPGAVDGWQPAVTQSKLRPSGQSLLSPHLRPVEDDNVSVSSERTAIPLSVIREEREAHGVDDPDSPVHTAGVILDPASPTGEERERCEVIQASIEDVELQSRLPQFLPYLDGEHTFEDIAAKEGFKRARVEDWFAELERQGYLLTFQSL